MAALIHGDWPGFCSLSCRHRVFLPQQASDEICGQSMDNPRLLGEKRKPVFTPMSATPENRTPVMLDIKELRKSGDLLKEKLARRGFSLDLAMFETMDADRKQADVRSQTLQAERNQAAKEVGKLIRDGVPVEEAKAQAVATQARIDRELQQEVEHARDIQARLHEWLLSVPNVPDDEVPDGKDENDNLEIRRWGEPRVFDFPVRDHVDVGAALADGCLDQEAGVKLSGARFSVLRGSLARLHRALASFMLDMHTRDHGYTEVYVPYLVGPEALRGTGQLPKFEEDLFRIAGERALYLIPTAEVPVTNLVADSILEPADLPLKMVCHTPCFRSEAGSHGKDTRGMIRQHQFDKVELVQIVPPGASDVAHEELTGHAQRVLEALELPYRVVSLCGGDLGFSAARTYDIEVWLPSQQCYREISSCSNFRDYQARRMQARWRNPDTARPELVHTINGSGLAVGRTLVAILENCQNKDGTLSIPQALRPYLGMD